MEHIKHLLISYFLTAATFTWGFLYDLGVALLIGFVGALGGFLFKLLLDAIKKRFK